MSEFNTLVADALDTVYANFGDAAVFSPTAGDDVALTVILESVEAWQPGTEIQYAATQQVVSYRRADIDRRVKSGETFTINGTVYTVYSMAPYPDSWSEFEGKAVVEAG